MSSFQTNRNDNPHPSRRYSRQNGNDEPCNREREAEAHSLSLNPSSRSRFEYRDWLLFEMSGLKSNLGSGLKWDADEGDVLVSSGEFFSESAELIMHARTSNVEVKVAPGTSIKERRNDSSDEEDDCPGGERIMVPSGEYLARELRGCWSTDKIDTESYRICCFSVIANTRKSPFARLK